MKKLKLIAPCALAALCLFWACSGPTALGPDESTPNPESSPDVADATAEPPSGDAGAQEADAASTAGDAAPEPAAPPPPEMRIEELETAAAPEGELVEAGRGTRLAPVPGGVRNYAGRIVAKMRQQLAREQRSMRRARSPGLVGSGSKMASPLDGFAGMGATKSAAPAARAPARPAATPPPRPSATASARPAAEPSAAAADDAESVTNTQVAGVDEGGIVKAWRDFLVVLRRGRLFTLRLGDEPGSAAPVSAISVRPPRSQHDAWYDEMLLHSATGTIVVIGFSYDHGASEIGLFRIADDGTLTHRQTHLLRSNDYYSSRNYASRLVGDTLVFYMPHNLFLEDYDERRDMETVRLSLPSTRPLRGGSWRSIVRSSQVYRIGNERNAATLHSVITCNLRSPRFSCQARGIIGGESRTFFVSRDAVYVWVSSDYPPWDLSEQEYDNYPEPSQQPSHLFRLPLDGARPSAVVVRGSPIDQFSFNETGDDLWVLVQAQGGGDAMWAPELPSGTLGLVHIPLSAFGTNVRVMSQAAYRTLPTLGRGSGSLQNRFIGDYVLYGQGAGRRRRPNDPGQGLVFLHRYREGRTFGVHLSGGVDRIEALANDAVVVGTDGANLHFRAVALDALPRPAGHYVRQGVVQGETRSHGFFYKPSGERRGVLGLPTLSAHQSRAPRRGRGSAEVLYLAVDQLAFSELGALGSRPEGRDDQCEVSCVDWYGNARPLFYRGRVFALLGYELVEGRISGGAIGEVARTSLLDVLPPPEVPVSQRQ